MARKEHWTFGWMSLRLRNAFKRILVHLGGVLTPQLLINPSLSAKLFAFKPTSNGYVVKKGDCSRLERDADGVPIPPKPLRIGRGTAEAFLSNGKEDMDMMFKTLKIAGIEISPKARVLEFGCSAGRQTRHMAPVLEHGEVWGVDLASEHIYWCQNHLDPRFNFLTVTSAPHLPFEDNYFDFVYAGSVFTHLDDLADAWFLELNRISKKGGVLFVTILDDRSLAVYKKEDFHNKPLADLILGSRHYKEFDEEGGLKLVIGRSLNSYVYYDTEYLTTKLSKVFEVVSTSSEAFRNVQSAYILRKK
jgi:SAM-dependent methyltransferase